MGWFLLLKKEYAPIYTKVIELQEQYEKEIGKDMKTVQYYFMRETVPVKKTLETFTEKDYVNLVQAVKSLIRPYQYILDEIEDLKTKYKFIRAFDLQPTDLENYYIYYTGHGFKYPQKWGEAAKDDISVLSMQKDGIEKVKTAVESARTKK